MAHRYDEAGNALGGVDIALLDRTMGYPTQTVLRRDLQAVLLKHAARAGIPVEFGHRAAAIDLDAHGRAVAHFENGVSIRPDLLIGADGRMDSVARKFVAGDNTPIYQGFVNWIGVAQGQSALVDDIAIQDFWGAGTRFGCVAIRTDLLYWAAAQARPLPGETSTSEIRKEIEDLFAGWPEPVARIIQATPAHAIRLIAVHDLEPLHTWSRANVLLIGDAAHAPLPTSGQGACQALEDAWHLARCLEGAGGSLDEVFQQFTKSAVPRLPSWSNRDGSLRAPCLRWTQKPVASATSGPRHPILSVMCRYWLRDGRKDYPCHSMQAACLWMASASAVCTLLNKLARLDNGWSPPQ